MSVEGRNFFFFFRLTGIVGRALGPVGHLLFLK